MNSEINQTTATRKSLPAKYNQVLTFGYWFLNHLKSNGTITLKVYEEYLNTFHVFDGIEPQMQYLNNFFDDFKIIQKNLKTDVREKNKKMKTKTKKSKITDPDQPPKKRGRKKKEVIDNRTAEQKLIDEIVANAQNEVKTEEMTDVKSEVKTEEMTDVKSEVKWIVVGEHPVTHEDDSSEEEIDVRKFINNNIVYLIDDNNNVYDYQSHQLIGTWNDVSQKIDVVEDNSEDDFDEDCDGEGDDGIDRSRFTEEKLTQYDQNSHRNNKYGRELYIRKIFDIRRNGLYCTKTIKKAGCVLKIEGGCLVPREKFNQLQSIPCGKFTPRTREYEKYVKVSAEHHDDVMLNIYDWEEKACTMNHSCSPNAYIVAEDGVNRHGQSCKHFCVYALEDIPKNTEITIDYGWSAKNFNELKFCKCGSNNCRGVIHKNGTFLEKNGKMYKQFQDEEPVFLPKCEYMPIFDYDYIWNGDKERINHRWEFTDEPDLLPNVKSKPKRGRKRKFQYVQTVGHLWDDEPYGDEFNGRPTRNITMYFHDDDHIEKRQFRRDDIGNVFELDDDCKINSVWAS